jgi:hypothetical protein
MASTRRGLWPLRAGRAVWRGLDPIAAVSDRRAEVLGSPKRKLREYALLNQTPFHIPSARASGFQGIGHLPLL